MFESSCLGSDDPDYPPTLRRHLDERAPDRLTLIGDPAILRAPTIALFCSVRCPGNLILKIYDLARALRDAGRTVAGGFQAPMERECLALLLRGNQPVIVCPARGLAAMRVPGAWRGPIAAGRLLIVSPFGEKQRRVTAGLAQARNAFVAALAGEIVVAQAAAGSRLIDLTVEAVGRGQPVSTLPDPANAALLAAGARPFVENYTKG